MAFVAAIRENIIPSATYRIAHSTLLHADHTPVVRDGIECPPFLLCSLALSLALYLSLSTVAFAGEPYDSSPRPRSRKGSCPAQCKLIRNTHVVVCEYTMLHKRHVVACRLPLTHHGGSGGSYLIISHILIECARLRCHKQTLIFCTPTRFTFPMSTIS
jgi:hypothetical protein